MRQVLPPGTSRAAGPHRPRAVVHVRPVALCGVLLAATAAVASAQTIRGTLLEVGTDQPIQAGLVVMLTEEGDSVTSAVTDEDGHFSLTSPEPGSFRLLAAALGYRRTPAGIFDLGEGGEMSVEFRIAPRPLPLDEILASVDEPAVDHELVRNGFVSRYQRSAFGHFITPHDLETSPATRTEDLFFGIPGVWVRPSPGNRDVLGDIVTMTRWRTLGSAGPCVPTVFVDGMRVRYDPTDGLDLSMIVPLSAVWAVEVYRSPAEVPLQFGGPGQLCGVLVFWTKVGR